MSILFVTGAGISANAGIPTYRDGGSSWKDADLEKKSHANRYGNHLDELWDRHWGPVSAAMATAQPTYTHKAIAAFQQKHPAIVATQNIETLHEQAGSDNVAHLHGDMTAKCIRCKGKNVFAWSGEGAPACRDCGKTKTRPDVVLFGEMLNNKLMKGLERFATQPETTHIIAIGTSLNVFPAAGLVFDVVGKIGKRVVIINKKPTAYDKWANKAINDDCDSVIDDVLAEVDEQIAS